MSSSGSDETEDNINYEEMEQFKYNVLSTLAENLESYSFESDDELTGYRHCHCHCHCSNDDCIDVSSDEEENPLADELSQNEEELNGNDITNFVSCLQQSPGDGDMAYELAKLLGKHNYEDLAYQTAKVCLNFVKTHEDLEDFLAKYPRVENSTLQNTLRNLWFEPQEYHQDDFLNIRQPNKKNDEKELDLDGILAKPDEIPSLTDTMVVIPNDKDFSIFRKFYLQKYSMYQLVLQCAFTPNMEVNLLAETVDGTPRVNFKLPRSQIQYKFNSSNLDCIHLGIKGVNKKGVGQLRIAKLSLKKLNYGPDGMSTNLAIRELTPRIPVIASMMVNYEDQDRIAKTVASLIDQVDRINLYLNQWKGEKRLMEVLQPYLNHAKFKLTQGQNESGFWHLTREIAGYHFIVSPKVTYHEEYVPLTLSKIQQYDHRAVIGLKGVQLVPKDRYKNYLNSRHLISQFVGVGQDIKVHLLGLETMAYFTGGLYLRPEEFSNDLEINNEVWIGILGQKQKVPFICMERYEPLAFLQPGCELTEKASEKNDQLIRENMPWNFN